MRASGLGFTLLARYAKDHAPPKRQKHGLRILRWNKATIRLMLKCQTYREVVVGAQDFDTVSRMADHGAYPLSTEGAWPLRGAVKCFCGRRLSGRMNGRKSWRRRYYVCTEPKATRYFQAQVLETAFVAFLRTIRAHPDLAFDRSDQDAIAFEARAKVNEIRRQLHVATGAQSKAWELAEQGGISPEQLKTRLEQHEEHVRKLNGELAKAEADAGRAMQLSGATREVASIVEALPEYWDRFPSETQREIAALVAVAMGGLRLTPESTSQRVTITQDQSPQSAEMCLQMSAVWDTLGRALTG
jgi:hypothetical protein